MTATVTPTRSLRSGRPMVVVLTILCVILGVTGGILVAASLKDYSSYTESTIATVTDVVVDHHSSRSRHHHSTSYDYYVDYEAEGDTFADERLSGVTSGRLHEGDEVTLVYPPGAPEDAVTEATTTATTAHVLQAVGVGLLVVAVGGITALVVAARRRRARSRERDAAIAY